MKNKLKPSEREYNAARPVIFQGTRLKEARAQVQNLDAQIKNRPKLVRPKTRPPSENENRHGDNKIHIFHKEILFDTPDKSVQDTEYSDIFR